MMIHKTLKHGCFWLGIVMVAIWTLFALATIWFNGVNDTMYRIGMSAIAIFVSSLGVLMLESFIFGESKPEDKKAEE